MPKSSMDLATELLITSIFVWSDNFICKFINGYIPKRIIDGIEINNYMFFDNIFIYARNSIGNCNSNRIKL